MKRHYSLTIAALIILAVVAGVLVHTHGQNGPLVTAVQAQTPTPPVAVQTTRPDRRSVSRLIALPGDLHPIEEATVYAKVPGYLEHIYVDKGDRVKAGQLLAEIQAPELQADREQAQQSYRSAVASAESDRAAHLRAQAEGQRAQELAQKARADYAQAPAAVQKAKAQVQQMQGALRQAEAQQQQADAALEESQAQAQKAQSDLEAARAEQRLADLTYTRYQGIYAKDPMLIARQDVDTAESKATAARGKAEAAQHQVEAAQRHVAAAQAQVDAAASQIAQAQAQLQSTQEQVTIAQAQQESLRKQMEAAGSDVAISKRQLEVTHARVEEGQYQANAGRSAAGKSAVLADYAHIRAPFDGVIVQRHVDPGAFIQTASTNQNAAPIVTVANLSAVRLYLNVPEADAAFVRVGAPVTLTTAGLPDIPFTARVTRTTASLDPKTRTLLVEVDLPNREGRLLPGAYVTAKVVLETHPDVLSVPSAAIVSEKVGKSVFIVENGKAKKVPITAGFNDGTWTEIVDGLHSGEEVVVVGKDALTTGAGVNATKWVPQKKPGHTR